MGFRKTRWTRFVTVAVLALVIGAVRPVATGRATEPVAKKAANAADAPKLGARASEIVQRMAERIVAADRYRVGGEVAWDVVQSDGLSLEFGATREVTMQRPDHLSADIDLREGGKRRLFYDGKQIVVQDVAANVYAIHPWTGPVDDMVTFVSDRLGIPVALSEFFSPDLAKLLGEHLKSASYIGESTIDGVRCDHVALRNDVGGMQLWVAQDDSLPRRIVITYEHAPGRPQFRAHLTGWDLAPQITEATFAFDPPKDAERIVFAPRPTARKKGGSK